MIINIVALLVGFTIKIVPGIELDDISNLNGSLCCFFLVYLIPIIMRLTVYEG